MANIQINATSRKVRGRGASRRLRGSGVVPGILYGGLDPEKVIELDHKMLLMELGKEAFLSSIITLEIDGKKEEVLLRDYQMHPWKKQVLHIDFQRVSADKLINMNVPLHFINEDVAPGVKVGGGVVNRVLSELAIQCLPSKLPEYIEVDVGELEVGGTMHLSELKIPDGVEAVLAQKGEDPALATVQVPRAVVEEETDLGEPEDGAAEGGAIAEEESGDEKSKEGDGEKS